MGAWWRWASGPLTDTLPKGETAGLNSGGGGGLGAEITLRRHRTRRRAGCVRPRDLQSWGSTRGISADESAHGQGVARRKLGFTLRRLGLQTRDGLATPAGLTLLVVGSLRLSIRDLLRHPLPKRDGWVVACPGRAAGENVTATKHGTNPGRADQTCDTTATTPRKRTAMTHSCS